MHLPTAEELLAAEDDRRRLLTAAVAVATLPPLLLLFSAEPLQTAVDDDNAVIKDFDWVRRLLLLALEPFLATDDERFCDPDAQQNSLT